jgi:hypothetical protein
MQAFKVAAMLDSLEKESRGSGRKMDASPPAKETPRRDKRLKLHVNLKR